MKKSLIMPRLHNGVLYILALTMLLTTSAVVPAEQPSLSHLPVATSEKTRHDYAAISVSCSVDAANAASRAVTN